MNYFKIYIFIILLPLLCLQSNSYAFSINTSSIKPGNLSNISLGYGYDSLLGIPRGICIDMPSIIPKPRSQSVNYSIKLIENSLNLYEFMGVDIKAAASFNSFSGSAKARWTRSYSLSTYSVYLGAKVSVRNQARRFDRSKAKLIKSIKTLLQADTDSAWASFHTKCGDLFAYSELRGGELYVIYEF